MKQKPDTSYPVLVTNNIIFARDGYDTTQQEVLFKVLNILKNSLTEEPEKLKDIPDSLFSFRVMVDGIEHPGFLSLMSDFPASYEHPKRVIKSIEELKFLPVDFHYDVPEGERGKMGAPLLVYVKHVEGNPFIEMGVNRIIIPYLRYTGPTSTGLYIGTTALDFVQFSNIKCSRLRKLYAIFMADMAKDSRITTITYQYDKFCHILSIPKTYYPSHVKERVLDVFTKEIFATFHQKVTSKILDRHKHPIEDSANSKAYFIEIKYDRNADIVSTQEVEILNRWFISSTAIKLYKNNIWLYMYDPEARGKAIKLARELEQKLSDPNSGMTQAYANNIFNKQFRQIAAQAKLKF